MHSRLARTRGGVRAVALLLAALLAGAGCSAPAAGEGTARLAVSGAPAGVQVASVVVTVTGGGGPDFPAFAEALASVDGSWGGYLTGIPAGPARRFEVVAYDAAGAARYRGVASSDIEAGAVSDVTILLTDAPAPPFQNSAPVIDALWTSQTLVAPAGTVQLGVLAHDPDPGDSLAARWWATCGTLDVPSATTVTWTAPATTGGCDVGVTVSDATAASVTAFVHLDVS